jgi:glycosyltransferase involved in cell wall biosynthesis
MTSASSSTRRPTFVLYRRSIDVRSGAGQLLRMQVRGLRARGARVRLVSRRGALRFFLRTGLAAESIDASGLAVLAKQPGICIVDHSLEIPTADFVFVHNLHAAALEFLPRDDWRAAAAREAVFFAALDARACIVANSSLVKAQLIRRFGLASERIAVEPPGFRADKFAFDGVMRLRARARRLLGIASDAPLVGLVTSGDFAKRGLDVFVAAAERIVDAVPAASFLVVGSKSLPVWAAAHPLTTSGRLQHRPKSGAPELWLAALDVLLYPAHFEEFGIVVAEAQALGVAVVTSRRVGASEYMAEAYDDWLIESPDAGALADRTAALLTETGARAALAAAGRRSVAAYDQRRYVEATVARLLDQNPKLK